MAATPLQTLMSQPMVQARLLNMIVELEGYLRDPDFMSLLPVEAGTEVFRFYMKGSNAARMHVATSFPLPLKSDFDMVLLVNPLLHAYKTVRALLIQRLFEFFESAVSKSAGFFDMPVLPADQFAHNERLYNSRLSDDLPSYHTTVFPSSKGKGAIYKPYPAPPTASFIYIYTNNIAPPTTIKDITVHGNGISILKVVPRLQGGIDSVLDIIIPSRDYEGLYREWAASDVLTKFNLMVGSRKMVIHLLDPFVLDAELRRAEATESRADKLKTRRELISLLEAGRLRQLL